MSVDPAHSLADSFDLGERVLHGNTADPLPVRERLFFLEVNINHEMKLHWSEISAYTSSVLRTAGTLGVEAEEMAIFPGMEELSAMMYVNQYHRRGLRVIMLDCAPTAESLRFVSLPTTLDWYMKHIFGFQRTMLKGAATARQSHCASRTPARELFPARFGSLFDKIDGIDKVFEDPPSTSVRLVTNPEKMVLARDPAGLRLFHVAWSYGGPDIVNRVLPQEAEGPFSMAGGGHSRKCSKRLSGVFSPVPVRQVPCSHRECSVRLAWRNWQPGYMRPMRIPPPFSRNEKPYQFVKNGDGYEVRITMPFTEKTEIGLFKKQDELVVEVGTVRRHVGLPTSMAALEPVKARLDGSVLVVDMREAL